MPRSNEKKLKEMQESIDDIKRRISRLNLSSYVSPHPPQGHVDLTPCLEPQAIALAPQPREQQAAASSKPTDVDSQTDAFLKSYSC